MKCYPPISVMKMVTIDIPDHFIEDNTKRGKIVDILFQGSGFESGSKSVRASLSGMTKAAYREEAYGKLERAYARADQIICIMESKED